MIIQHRVSAARIIRFKIEKIESRDRDATDVLCKIVCGFAQCEKQSCEVCGTVALLHTVWVGH